MYYAAMRPSPSFSTSSSFGAAAHAYAEESVGAGGSYTSLGAADALDGAPSRSPAPLVLELEVVVDAPTLVSDGISTSSWEFPLRTRSSLPTCVACVCLEPRLCARVRAHTRCVWPRWALPRACRVGAAQSAARVLPCAHAHRR
jgi:hypothetical protein